MTQHQKLGSSQEARLQMAKLLVYLNRIPTQTFIVWPQGPLCSVKCRHWSISLGKKCCENTYFAFIQHCWVSTQTVKLCPILDIVMQPKSLNDIFKHQFKDKFAVKSQGTKIILELEFERGQELWGIKPQSFLEKTLSLLWLKSMKAYHRICYADGITCLLALQQPP